MKLPSQFAALVPKVREFLEERAFGARVDLSRPEMVTAIGSNVAAYVTIRRFVHELRKVVVEELQPQLIDAGRAIRNAAVPVVKGDPRRAELRVQQGAVRQQV